MFEPLESRLLLSVSARSPIQPQSLSINASTSLDLFRNFTDPSADPVATVTTDEGAFQIQLFAQQAPRTVDNFADYVNSGAYNGTIVHRSVPGFIVQLGGYKPDFTHIATSPRVINEPGISNTLGTVALAKLGGSANSATSEFFVNTGDNSSNLDGQNAGFAVFGQVINGGMPVVNQINNLPTTTVQGFSDVPVKTNPPAIPGDLVTVQSVSLTPQFTYAIANSNPGVLTAQLNGEELVLSSGAQTGVANITVTATDAGSHSVSETFAVTVGTRNVTIGAGQTAQTVNFVSANKGVSSVTLKGGGSAALTFSGSNINSTTKGAVTTVSGSGLKIANIATTGTGAASVLTITGSPEVDHIAADAALKQINAKGVTLNGSIEAAGTVTALALNKAANGRISLGGSSSSPAVATITLGSAADEDLVSDAPIKSISVGSWGNDNSILPLINAPSIGSITAKGNFTPSLDIGFQNSSGTVLGNLGSAKIGGAIGAGHWRILGSVSSISAGSVPKGWNGQVSGNLSSFAVAHDMNGSINTNMLGTMKVGGNLTASTIDITGAFGVTNRALNSFTVNGSVSGLVLIVQSSINSITVGSLSGSTLFAGADTGTTLPAAIGDFANDATIGSVTIRDKGASSFVNTNIAAHNLGKLSLGSIQTSNGSVAFGLAANTIASLTASDTAGHKFKLTGISPSNVATILSGLGFSPGDFQVRAV